MTQEEKEMKECSFRPRINKTARSSNDRCKELYKLTKKKEDKSAIDYEYERNSEQCTFKPDIKKPEVDSTPVNVDKKMLKRVIERVRKGREERERVKLATSNNKDDAFIYRSERKSKVQTSSKLTPRSMQNPKGKAQIARNIESNTELAPDSHLEHKESMKPLSDTQSVNQSHRNSQLPSEPLLFIDVNLGEDQKRIVVYKGDNGSKLAEEFARENSKYFN